MTDDLTRAATSVLTRLRTSDAADANAILTRLDRKILEAHRDGDADRLRTLQDIRRRAGVSHTRHLDATGRVLYETRGGALEIVRDSVPTVAFGRSAGVTARVRSTTSTALYGATMPRQQTETPHLRGPVKHVFLGQGALRKIRMEGTAFDGLERAFVLFGVIDDDGTLTVMSARDVSSDRKRHSVILDPHKWDDAVEHVERNTELVVVGDLHTHPASVETVANPSDADLKHWRQQLRRKPNAPYIGIVMNRGYDADDGWDAPVFTAFSVFDDNGSTGIDILPVEVEPADAWITH